MTKEPKKPVSSSPEKPADVSKRSAVLAALSFLSASMGLSLNDVAMAQDVTVNKAKTADKAFSAMDGYIRGRVKPGGSTGPNRPPPPTGNLNPALQTNALKGATDSHKAGGWDVKANKKF
jgi:hypothetical protein